MIIPWVFNIIFLSLKETTFSLLFTFSYQSTEAFDSKAKQKANTWGQIMPSMARNCVCGLKNWVESQEENDMDFWEQTEKKSRSNFSTSQPCHYTFKALAVSVWWSLCKAMGTELMLWEHKELSIWESGRGIIRESQLLLFSYFKSRLTDHQVTRDYFGCLIRKHGGKN